MIKKAESPENDNQRLTQYHSTNRKSPEVNFYEALLAGQAPDRGLYMPGIIPRLSIYEINAMRKMTYAEIASALLSKFLEKIVPEETLKKVARSIYTFGIPIEPVVDGKYVLRLDQGPTASFKDFAACMMARLMCHAIQNTGRELVVLTATSGDTGGAVAKAFTGASSIRIVILFPAREVSARQRKQMTTLGRNVTALAVEGKFDDCQALVKNAFADPDLVSLNLTSANSINIGRLLPQTIYYFYAYAKLARSSGEKIIFSVPCGNLGNLVGGLIAKRMGLPVAKFIAATNENDSVPKFFASGEYTPIRPSRLCISNSMNVGHPSNLARLVDLYGGKMDENGIMSKLPNLNLMRDEIYAVSISDDHTRRTIRNVYERCGTVLEPHGAVAWAGLENFSSSNQAEGPAVSLETAHPAKFSDEIKKLLSLDPPLPPSMQGLETKEEKFGHLKPSYEEFKKLLQQIQ